MTLKSKIQRAPHSWTREFDLAHFGLKQRSRCAFSPVAVALTMATMIVGFGFSSATANAEDIGCVSTTFRGLGLLNDKICVESFKDPDIEGVVCHVSRAKTGGVKGKIGLAEDTSDAAIACRQTGPITLPEKVKDGDDVFTESRSLIFKKLHVVRFFDKANNTLVYLSYSDRVIEGSPKNAISTVPIMPWRN